MLLVLTARTGSGLLQAGGSYPQRSPPGRGIGRPFCDFMYARIEDGESPR
jgi:hypothetical protein